MLKQVISIAILALLALSVTAQGDAEPTETIIHISPYQQSCVGVAPQDCLLVRSDDEEDLSFFYDDIEGFSYEEGFEYTLLVKVSEVDNAPADASSLQYELVEILQQFPAFLGGRVWELQSLNGELIEDPSRYTLILNDEGIVLKADCNTVHANLTINPFDIETTISTKVMCPEDSLDLAYLEALNNANLISIENGELILQSSEGQLRFSAPSIEGIEWTLTRVLGMAMMLELDDSASYTLQIDDTTASMMIACNSAGGTVEVEGAILHFTNVYSTLMGCANDPLPGMFPPENAVYYINEAGHLILEDSMTNLYEFTRSEA